MIHFISDVRKHSEREMPFPGWAFWSYGTNPGQPASSTRDYGLRFRKNPVRRQWISIWDQKWPLAIEAGDRGGQRPVTMKLELSEFTGTAVTQRMSGRAIGWHVLKRRDDAGKSSTMKCRPLRLRATAKLDFASEQRPGDGGSQAEYHLPRQRQDVCSLSERALARPCRDAGKNLSRTRNRIIPSPIGVRFAQNWLFANPPPN